MKILKIQLKGKKMKYYKTNNSVVFTKNNKYVVLTKTKNGVKITNVSDEDVDWITVRGNHIPVKKGQSKEEAVKSFIDGKRGSGKKEGSGSGKTSIKKDLIEVDSLAKKIKKDASYEDVLERPWDVYDIIGVGDSGLREEIFIAISDKYNVKYDDLYNAWLNGRWDKGKEIKGKKGSEKEGKPSGIKFKERSSITDYTGREKYAIDTGIKLDDKKYRILESIVGQMSDGIWENSSQMEKYWKNIGVDKKDNNLIFKIDKENGKPDKYVRYGWVSNPFYNKSDDEIREFMADKLKKIVQIEIKDKFRNGKDIGKWSKDNKNTLEYVGRDNTTVSDVYEVYDMLKGRK